MTTFTQYHNPELQRISKQRNIFKIYLRFTRETEISLMLTKLEGRREENNEQISFLLVISHQNKSCNLKVWKSFQDVQRGFKRQMSDNQIGCRPTKSLSNTWTITAQKHLIKHLISQARRCFTISLDFFVWSCLIPSWTISQHFQLSPEQCVSLPRR